MIIVPCLETASAHIWFTLDGSEQAESSIKACNFSLQPTCVHNVCFGLSLSSYWAKCCFVRVKYQPVLSKPVLSVPEFLRNSLLLLLSSAFNCIFSPLCFSQVCFKCALKTSLKTPLGNLDGYRDGKMLWRNSGLDLE